MLHLTTRLLRSSGMTLDIETDDHSFDRRGNPKLSPQSKFIMELALQIVRLQSKKSIAIEHLL
jgi:putative transcriptional regulator